MSRIKLLGIATFVALVVALPEAAQADVGNKKTVLTVNETIQLPGAILEPGKYVMKLADSPSNRHIVQVFNEDETKVLATILAIPNYRLEPKGDSTFGFWETPTGSPRALRSWFYPGDNFGQEFVYPKQTAMTLARVSHERVPASDNLSKPSEAVVTTVDEKGKESLPEAAAAPAPREEPVEIAQNRPPATPEPTPTPAPAPAANAPGTLPSTGSPIPVVALAGLLSLGTAGLLRMLRSK